MIVEVIQHNADALGWYTLHAFVVMSNHVHVLVSPNIPLPRLTKALQRVYGEAGEPNAGAYG